MYIRKGGKREEETGRSEGKEWMGVIRRGGGDRGKWNEPLSG